MLSATIKDGYLGRYVEIPKEISFKDTNLIYKESLDSLVVATQAEFDHQFWNPSIHATKDFEDAFNNADDII